MADQDCPSTQPSEILGEGPVFTTSTTKGSVESKPENRLRNAPALKVLPTCFTLSYCNVKHYADTLLHSSTTHPIWQSHWPP